MNDFESFQWRREGLISINIGHTVLLDAET